jgi:hypothetical protein
VFLKAEWHKNGYSWLANLWIAFSVTVNLASFGLPNLSRIAKEGNAAAELAVTAQDAKEIRRVANEANRLVEAETGKDISKMSEKQFEKFSEKIKKKEKIIEEANELDKVADLENKAEKVKKYFGKRPTLPLEKTTNINGDITEYGKWYYERPAWKQKTVNEVWINAEKKGEGVVIDKLSKKEITWDKLKARGEQWHMGHKYGYEFRKHQLSSAKRKISIKQFRKEYNTAEFVDPELPVSNLGHKGEAPNDIYFGH